MAAVHYTVMESPVGDLLLAAEDRAIRYLNFQAGKHPLEPEAGWKKGGSRLLAEARRQLADYFAGRRTEFDLPVDPQGTDFQRAAWKALQKIPYGETRTYGQQAKAVGRPRAARAVGAANGRNPIAIIIPCHRVIGSTGALTGFGGGLDVKEFLLALERN